MTTTVPLIDAAHLRGLPDGGARRRPRRGQRRAGGRHRAGGRRVGGPQLRPGPHRGRLDAGHDPAAPASPSSCPASRCCSWRPATTSPRRCGTRAAVAAVAAGDDRGRHCRARPSPSRTPSTARGCTTATPTSAASCARSSRWRATSRAATPGSPAYGGWRRRPGPPPPSSSGTTSTTWSRSTRWSRWTDADVEAYQVEHDLPRNPLTLQGYPSIGCAPCTRRVARARTRGPDAGRARTRPSAGSTHERSAERRDRAPPDRLRPWPLPAGSGWTTSTPWSPRRSTSSARSRPSSSGRCCCSPAARTPSSCCTWPPRRSGRRRCRSRCCTSTRATTSPRCSTSATARSPGSAPGSRWPRCRTTSTTAGSRERTDGTRNPLQTQPLLDAIVEHRFDAVFGGARRDEEKARAKERIFSLRDEFGAWDPRNQRPELWNLYNGKHRPGEHVRVFPLSNWTELDIWRYIAREGSSCPGSTTPTSARCSSATGCGSPSAPWSQPREHEEVVTGRCATAPSATCPAPGRSSPTP